MRQNRSTPVNFDVDKAARSAKGNSLSEDLDDIVTAFRLDNRVLQQAMGLCREWHLEQQQNRNPWGQYTNRKYLAALLINHCLYQGLPDLSGEREAPSSEAEQVILLLLPPGSSTWLMSTSDLRWETVGRSLQMARAYWQGSVDDAEGALAAWRRAASAHSDVAAVDIVVLHLAGAAPHLSPASLPSERLAALEVAWGQAASSDRTEFLGPLPADDPWLLRLRPKTW